LPVEIIKKLSWQVLIALFLLPLSAWGYSEEECIRCHGSGSAESRLQIDADIYKTSIHAGEISCIDCHEAITGDAHFTDRGLEKVNCRNCHEQKNQHGRDVTTKCTDCHTRHAVYKADDVRSSVHWINLEKTCGGCHPDQTKSTGWLSVFTSFRIVSHPKQNMAGHFGKDMCVGCHQGKAAHGEDGPVNGQNCYRCHSPLDKERVILGYMHPYADWQKKPVNAAAGCISVIVLIGIIFIAAKDFMGRSDKRRSDHDGGKN